MSTGLRFTLAVVSFPPEQSFSALFSLDISLVSQRLLSIDFPQVLDKPDHNETLTENKTRDF